MFCVRPLGTGMVVRLAGSGVRTVSYDIEWCWIISNTEALTHGLSARLTPKLGVCCCESTNMGFGAG